MLQSITRTLGFWFSILMVGIILAGLFVLPVFLYFSKDLPDYNQLAEYDPPTISRIYSADGELMAELAKERRIFRKIDEIPQLVIDAFLAAEDQNYYNHPGIDLMSIGRAAFQNASNIGNDKNPVGGSTITQQVVKNFLLTNERSFSRKIKEAILAYRINKVYSKDRILELYLNQIYLGNGSYGVTSAALNYFNKDLDDVTLEEAALLAALPKAPSLLDPTRNPQKAKARRDWVLDRMYEENFIKQTQAKKAKSVPIALTPRYEHSILDNGYYTESVRLQLIEMYGEDKVYQDGLSAHANLDKNLQKYADDALRSGLIEYDRRHGFKGAVTNLKFKGDEWKSQIKSFEVEPASTAGGWKPAIVIAVSNDQASIGFKDGSKSFISLSKLTWARKRLDKGYVGKKVESAKDVLKQGDVIYVSPDSEGKGHNLEQIPDANGALVAIQPKTGKVLALAGGYSFKESKYNRAIQAVRQPGSTFKPFVYLAALEKGFSPNSILKDEPISISQGPGMPAWTPKNFEGSFLGDITLRKALEKSRNLATVHLLTLVGLDRVREVSTRLKIYNNPPKIYSMALGAHESTLIQMTAAYASFASNGLRVEPKLIDRVQDRKGRLIFGTDLRRCDSCLPEAENSSLKTHDIPSLKFTSSQVIDPAVNYQMVSILQGVVERGTAARAKQLGKVLAGKTGTSNDSNDTWFIGFSPDLVCGIYIGYDQPKSLGAKESGSTVALPIFISFMKNALADMPNKEFEIPTGIEFVKIDDSTGNTPGVFSNQKNIVNEPMRQSDMEIFKALTQETQNLDNSSAELGAVPQVEQDKPNVEGVY